MIISCLLTAVAGGLVGRFSEGLATELFGGAAQKFLDLLSQKATPETNHDFYKAVEAALAIAATRAFDSTDNAVERVLYKEIENNPGKFLSDKPNTLTTAMQRALIVGNQADLQAEIDTRLDRGCPNEMRPALPEAKRRFSTFFATAFGEAIKSDKHEKGFKVFLTQCLQTLHEKPQALNWPAEAIVAIPELAEDLPRLAESVDQVVRQFTQVLEGLQEISEKQDRIHQETMEAINAPKPRNLFAFNQPSRNFAGREEQFTEILAQLKNGQTTHVTQPIAGMGGMGKSQIAREFARRSQCRQPDYPQFSCIQEVDATSEFALIKSLGQVVKNLGLANQEVQIPPENLRPLLEKALAGHKPWLLYVDSLDDPNHARPEVVINGVKQNVNILPRPNGGAILLTSRHDVLPAWLSAGNPITVPVFPPEVSRNILLDRAIPPDRDATLDEQTAAAAIAEKLLHYPLSIEQAASYCSHRLAQTTLAQYVVLLNQTADQLPPDHGEDLAEYERTARVTMSLALERISPEARDLLRFMAWIAPSSAPADMIAAVLRKVGLNLAGDADWQALVPLVKSLRSQGLLEAADAARQTLTLHAVSGAAWRSLLTEEQRREELEKWLSATWEALPTIDAESALALGDWIAHGAAMLDFARALDMKESIQGNVGNAFGLACVHLGRYDEAEPLYTRALELRREVLGERHPDTLTSMNNLAALFRATGRYVEAEPLFSRALELDREELGEIHPGTIMSMNNLAGLYNATGRYVEAEPLYSRALELYREELGEIHPGTIMSMCNLATFWIERGDPQGRVLLCEAYRLSRALPERHEVRVGIERWVEGLKLDCGG